MEEAALQYLADHMRVVSIPVGPVIRENEPTPGLYIIRSGMAGVTKAAESGSAEAMLATLGAGSSFGEIGLIDGLPASTNVTAMQPMECYFLPREAFLAGLDQHPEIARGMLPALATMVRNTDKLVFSQSRSVRIEATHLGSGVLGGETPVDGGSSRVALRLIGADVPL